MWINTWLTYFFNIYKSRCFHKQCDKQFAFHLERHSMVAMEKKSTNIHLTFMMQLLFRQQHSHFPIYYFGANFNCTWRFVRPKTMKKKPLDSIILKVINVNFRSVWFSFILFSMSESLAVFFVASLHQWEIDLVKFAGNSSRTVRWVFQSENAARTGEKGWGNQKSNGKR